MTRPAFTFRELVLFLAGQVVVLGPLVAWSLVRGVLHVPERVVRGPFRLPATLFFVPLAVFAALALVSRANANWTAFALVPAAVLVASLAVTDGRTRLLLAAVLVNVVIAAVLVANALDCDAVRLGSAGAKAMAVVLGEADIYVHDGGMYQWDSAAPAAVAMAAGLHASRIDGSPLVYNQRDLWLPDFLICRPELAEPVLDAIWGEGKRGRSRR